MRSSVYTKKLNHSWKLTVPEKGLTASVEQMINSPHEVPSLVSLLAYPIIFAHFQGLVIFALAYISVLVSCCYPLHLANDTNFTLPFISFSHFFHHSFFHNGVLIGVCYRPPNCTRKRDDYFLMHLSTICRGKKLHDHGGLHFEWHAGGLMLPVLKHP